MSSSSSVEVLPWLLGGVGNRELGVFAERSTNPSIVHRTMRVFLLASRPSCPRAKIFYKPIFRVQRGGAPHYRVSVGCSVSIRVVCASEAVALETAASFES